MRLCLVVMLLISACAGCTGVSLSVDRNFDHSSVKSVAILPFTFAPSAARQWNYLVAAHLVNSDGGNLTSAKFITALLGTGCYSIKERGDLETIIREKKFNQSEFADPDRVREIGKLLKIDAIVFGSVDDFSFNWYGLIIFARASMNVKCVHVESGTILWSASGLSWLYLGTPEGRAIALAESIAEELKEKLSATIHK